MAMRMDAARRVGRLGPALAVVVLVVGAACAVAPARPPPGFAAKQTVNIVFSGGCPQKADPPVKSCGPTKPQCIRVNYGDQVLFQATDANGSPTQDKFAVQFDPFQGPPNQGVGFVLLTVRMDAKHPVTKEFPYNVQSGTCPPLDPQIIVDW